MPVVKFFDIDIRPPRGGWAYTYKGVPHSAHSEGELIESILALERNNGRQTPREEIEREIWTKYCANEPTRCGFLPHEVPAQPALAPREVTKELQGPPIWGFLNTMAVQWQPGIREMFAGICEGIISIMVCPICRTEWRAILDAKHPGKLETRYEVCRWLWDAHNTVNSRAGKSFYSYERFVSEWGAPLA